ncbi:MAG: serine/threonine-protein phosphatase [Oscillospiraceae bacterium]|nr:serine/threonine-protein phosphatase [Oscillospiraceae bacterium]
MRFTLDAACLCHTGRVRKNNEDNFFFDGRCMEADNNGLKHPVTMTKTLRKEVCVAVFDGMGGENFGELASFAAADCMQNTTRRLMDYFIPERRFLQDMCRKINEAVLAKQKELCTEHMGSTMVALYFSHDYVYVCNLGDSRAYRLRDGEFLQLSEDHVEKREDQPKKKTPLTQHLGINPEDFLIEPYIAKGELKAGDVYLLCSDGLTDMLSNLEIDEILSAGASPEEDVRRLVDAALEKGGKDNVTAIVCRVW